MSIHNEKIKFLIILVPSNKNINKISIDLEVDGKQYYNVKDIKNEIFFILII